MSGFRKGSNHAMPAIDRRRRRVREMTVPEIKAELRDEGIEFPSKAVRDDLVRIYARQGA